MNSIDLYNPKDVAELTGASASAVRNYTDTYARYLSTEATSTPRKFTAADVKLIAFVVHCTKDRALTHDQVLELLVAGDLENFEWQLPARPIRQPQGPQQATETVEAYLVPVAQLQAAQALMQDAREREQAAQQQVQALQDEIKQIRQELGKAEGELTGVRASRYRAPKWWRAIFGGRESE